MPKKLNGFDRIAPIYDGLSRLVFGKSIRNAQLNFLNEVPANSNVLIVGGGTGWLLVELLKVNPTCKVWYVEASQTMLNSARKKVSILGGASVQFIHGTEEFLPDGARFDAIIANFYFDLFTPSSLARVLTQLKSSFSGHAILLVSDFTNSNFWSHRILLAVMYRFFRLCCGIESTHLPDLHNQLALTGLKEVKYKLFYGGFIKSSVYST